MSSTPGITPSTLPPVAQMYHQERKLEPTQKPERRSTASRQELNRRTFERTADFVRRYSVPTSEMTPDEVRTFLTKETHELKHVDPLVKLAFLVESGRLNPQEEEVLVGSYRFVSPSIKRLNDIYLDQIQTDDLIFNDLSDVMKHEFCKDPEDLLSANFKGGIVVMKTNELSNGSGRTPQEVLDAKIVDMHDHAKRLLLKHIQRRSDTLERRKMELAEQLEDELFDTDRQTIYEQIQRIDTNLEALRSLNTDVEIGREKVDLAFGFDKVATKDNDLQDLFMAIRNAECATNMAVVDSKENGHRHPKMYSHQEFLVEAIRTLQLLGEFGIVDENGSIKDEWKPFFYADSKGYLRMQPDMIKIYRRLGKYRTSSDYQAMNEGQKRDFENKMSKFEQYYLRINIVDVLKRFQERNFTDYAERIEAITSLVQQAEAALSVEPGKLPNVARMRDLLDQTSSELEVSLKDEGQEIIQTTRSLIKGLFEEGEKVLVFTDNIGFGAINQASYEESVINLVNMLNISDQEWDTMNGSREKLETMVAQKYAVLANDPNFTRAIVGIGDFGSQHLRSNEEKAQRLFGGPAVVDSEMGDETKVLYQVDENPLIPHDQEALKRKLLQFSMETRMRIAAIMTNFHFTPLVDPTERLVIQEETREEILHLIELMNWAADAHDKIKDLNALGYHKVESKQDNYQKAA